MVALHGLIANDIDVARSEPHDKSPQVLYQERGMGLASRTKFFLYSQVNPYKPILEPCTASLG